VEMSEEDVYIEIPSYVEDTPVERFLIVFTVVGIIALGAGFGAIVWALERMI
jgi:hypothetical protein